MIGAPLTLASARRLATELHRQRAMGKDVVAARHREKLERKVRGAKTFAQAAMDFVEQHSMRKTRRWQDRARLLGVRPAVRGGSLELIPKGLADRWRDRPITEIDGDQVHAIIDEVRERGVPGLESVSTGRVNREHSRCLPRLANFSAGSSSVAGSARTLASPFTDRRHCRRATAC